MASKNVAEIILRAKDEASRELQKVQGGLGNLGKAALVAGAAFVAIKGAQAVLRGVGNQLREATAAAIENSKAALELRNALAAANETGEHAQANIEAQATALQRQGVMAGAAATRLGAYILNLGVAADTTPQLIRASVDLGAALKLGPEAAAQQLARTLQGDLSPRLSRMIPEIAELTDEQLRAGDAITIVEQRFRGMAEATLTNADRVENLKGTWGDFRGSLIHATVESRTITETIQALNGWLLDLTSTVNGMDLGPALASAAKGIVDVAGGINEIFVMFGSDKAEAMANHLADLSGSMERAAERAKRAAEDERSIRNQVASLQAEQEALMARDISNRQRQLDLQERIAHSTGQHKAMLQSNLVIIDQQISNFDADLNALDAKLRPLRAEMAKAEAEAKRTSREGIEEARRQAEAAEKAAAAAAERRRAMIAGNQALADDVRALGVALIRDEEQRIQAQLALDEEAVNARVGSEQRKLELIALLNEQATQRIADIRERTRLAEESEAGRAAKAEADRLAKEEREQQMALERMTAAKQRAHDEAMRMLQEEENLRLSQGAKLMSIAQQVGAAAVDEQRSATKEILIYLAREAAAAAAAHAIKELGLIGVALSVPIGLAAGALVRGLESATFHTGGLIGPNDGIRSGGANRVIRTQEGEAVLNRQAVQRVGRESVEAMNAGTGGSSPSIQISLHSLDAQTVEMELRDGGRLNRALRSAMRRGDV